MNFKQLVETILYETTVAGGINSTFGSNVTKTSSAFSGDIYAKENGAIKPCALGGGQIITRRGIKRRKKKK